MALRALLIGGGERGRQWLQRLRANGSWEIAGVVEPDERAAGHVKALGDGVEILRSLEPASGSNYDAAIVATPPDAHLAPATWAVEQGIGALVEKPLTCSLAEAVELVTKAEANAVPIVVGQNYRYRPDMTGARRLIQAGALGEIGFVTGHYYMAPLDSATTNSRAPHRVLWGMGVHHLDAFRHCLGRAITSVSASSFTLPWSSPPVGSSMTALLEFESGIKGVYSASYDSRGHEFFKKGQEFYARFVGSEATLHLFYKWLLLCPAGKLPRPIRGERGGTAEDMLLDQLAAAIRDGTEPECSGRDNLLTVAALEAFVRSAEENRTVAPLQLLEEIG